MSCCACTPWQTSLCVCCTSVFAVRVKRVLGEVGSDMRRNWRRRFLFSRQEWRGEVFHSGRHQRVQHATFNSWIVGMAPILWLSWPLSWLGALRRGKVFAFSVCRCTYRQHGDDMPTTLPFGQGTFCTSVHQLMTSIVV